MPDRSVITDYKGPFITNTTAYITTPRVVPQPIYTDTQRKRTDNSIIETDTGKIIDTSAAGTATPSTNEKSLESQDDVETPEILLPKRQFYMILPGLSVLYFLSALDSTILATAYIQISSQFQSLSTGMWIIISYMLASTAVQPLYGKVSDIIGRLEAIIFSILMFTIGSVMCALSNSMNMLIASRAVQGIGGGGLMTMCSVVMSDIVAERARGRYAGWFAGGWGIASAIGPILGGIIVEHTSWRIIFWVNLPVCIPTMVLMLFMLRLPRPNGSTREKIKRLDVLGTVALLAALIPMLLAFSWAGQGHKWSSRIVLACLVTGCAMVPVFLVVEWRCAREPIVPLSLLRVRNVAVSSIAHFFMGAASYVPTMFVPQWETAVQGSSDIVAGAHLLPFMLGTVVTAVVSGIVMTRMGRYRWVISLGGVLMAVGCGLLVVLARGSGEGERVGFMLIAGLGLGFCAQPMLIAAQCSVKGTDMATVTTLVMFLRTLGGIIALSILSSFLYSRLRDGAVDLIVTNPFYIFQILTALQDQSVLRSSGLPADIQEDLIELFHEGLHAAFIGLVPFVVLFALSSFMFEHVELNRSRKNTIK